MPNPKIYITGQSLPEFQVNLLHAPRVGDLFEVGEQFFRVTEILHRVETTDRSSINECTIYVKLEIDPELNYSTEQPQG